MHSENFSDHEMRILNPKTSFAGNVRERNEDRLGLKSQPQEQSFKGRLQNNNVAF